MARRQRRLIKPSPGNEGTYLDDSKYSPMIDPGVPQIIWWLLVSALNIVLLVLGKKEGYLVNGEVAITRRQIRTLGNCADGLSLLYLLLMIIAIFINFGNIRVKTGEGFTGGNVGEHFKSGLDGIKNDFSNSGVADRKIISLVIALIFQAMILVTRVIMSIMIQSCQRIFPGDLDEQGDIIFGVVLY
ncbi:hypothetical protein G9A89_010940 [Geosiphon pyriformis]|nr:hypothetical protein G9A89_010940 [Geosiphon pyriformis]